MEKSKLRVGNQDEVKSIQSALQILNDAAKESSNEIKLMMDRDYNKLKGVLTDLKPEVKHAFKEFGEASQEQLKQAHETVKESVHEHPWIYIGGATVISGLLGYILGRKS
ncbi:MAG: DUF883 family protein [Bdellovibrionaceae bacterium]|nr:DUF883 family protein [Pseudobdellovibrionaceae bacterium]